MSVQYLLDSDICIYVTKRRTDAILEKFDRFAPVCAISVIVLGELRYGQAKSARPAEAAANLDALLQTLKILPLPPEAAERYGDIRAHLQGAGTPIGANDLWIAAHALSADLTLVTNNEREFRRVPGLKVENWTKE